MKTIKSKKGISLILLIIIVILIIAAVEIVISLFSKTAKEERSEKNIFKSEITSYSGELQSWINNQRSQNPQTFDISKVNATKTEGTYNGLKIQDIITSMSDEDAKTYQIKLGHLVYSTDNPNEISWLSGSKIQILPGDIYTSIDESYYTAVAAGTEASPGAALTVNSTIDGKTPTYSNPVIPAGFMAINTSAANWGRVITDWNNGLVIQDLYGNQFVWVPVGYLKENGTMDGVNFDSKFGRRIFGDENFGKEKLQYDETVDAVLENMEVNIINYGGFYIARYESSNNGTVIKSNQTPDTNVSFEKAKNQAENLDTTYGWNLNYVESNLCYSAHFDTVLEWIIENKNKTEEQVKVSSVSWGNYINDTFSAKKTDISKTGVYSQAVANNIYDLAGNVWEWTMETSVSSTGENLNIVRGGSAVDDGDKTPVRFRKGYSKSYTGKEVGYRVVLNVK